MDIIVPVIWFFIALLNTFNNANELPTKVIIWAAFITIALSSLRIIYF